MATNTPTDGGGKGRWVERLSLWATDWSGRSETIVLALVLLVAWAASGPLLHYSDTWQLIINTFTSVVTFLMVFLIQRAQNKSSLAIQLKLNEIIAAMRGASNRLIAVEELSEDDLRRLHERYQQLAEITHERARLKTASSIEAVEQQLGDAEPHPPDAPGPTRPD
jgi:low affinity Fe/Cu permease